MFLLFDIGQFADFRRLFKYSCLSYGWITSSVFHHKRSCCYCQSSNLLKIMADSHERRMPKWTMNQTTCSKKCRHNESIFFPMGTSIHSRKTEWNNLFLSFVQGFCVSCTMGGSCPPLVQLENWLLDFPPFLLNLPHMFAKGRKTLSTIHI